MDNREFYQYLQAICDNNMEFEAIKELLEVAQRKYVQAAKDVVESRAKLRYISKFNDARYHDDAITALCE